tara:strand:+ start:2763 stop:2966 length:204 start_codon:yes stop_codon:yes gene_type:complete
MGLSAILNKPTPFFEAKVKQAHDVYVEDGGAMSFDEFMRMAWAFHKIESSFTESSVDALRQVITNDE